MPRRKQDQQDQGAPAWIVTFSDLMSLLLTFFVLLLSFSTISEKDFNDAMMSVRGALGVMDRFQGIMSMVPRQRQEQTDQARDVARRLRRRIQIQGLEKKVKVEFEAVGGLKINLPSEVLFAAGSAELRPQSHPVLEDIADVLRELPDTFIEVQGHTDASPLTTEGAYRDNYDLSYGRAYAVMARLAGPGGVPQEQFEITAAGASQPIAPNETEEGRRANRRVEIFVRGLIEKDTIEGLQEEQETLRDLPARETVPVTPREFDAL